MPAHMQSTTCPAEADDECLLRLYTLVYEPRNTDEVRTYMRDISKAAAARERNSQLSMPLAYGQQNNGSCGGQDKPPSYASLFPPPRPRRSSPSRGVPPSYESLLGDPYLEDDVMVSLPLLGAVPQGPVERRQTRNKADLIRQKMADFSARIKTLWHPGLDRSQRTSRTIYSLGG